MRGAANELETVSELVMVVECGLWPGASILLTAGLGTAKETAARTATKLQASDLDMALRMTPLSMTPEQLFETSW